MSTRTQFVFRSLFVLLLILPVAAFAQSALPATPSTTLQADVSEQAVITVPATVNFPVTNINATTPSASQNVSATSIVLVNTHKLNIALQANAASFTSPGGTSWAAGDVTWNAATFTNGTGASGTLSNSAANNVATTTANATSTTTSTLVFTLAANGAVTRAGAHTLAVTWHFDSIP